MKTPRRIYVLAKNSEVLADSGYFSLQNSKVSYSLKEFKICADYLLTIHTMIVN